MAFILSSHLIKEKLKQLEVAGIITGCHEISQSGKAIKYFELKSFDIHITPKLMMTLSKEIPDFQSNEV